MPPHVSRRTKSRLDNDLILCARPTTAAFSIAHPTPPLLQPGTELGEGPGGLLLTGLLQGVLDAAQEAAQAQRDRGVALLHAARRRAQPQHARLQMDGGPAARADRAHAAGEAPALAWGGDLLHGSSKQPELCTASSLGADVCCPFISFLCRSQTTSPSPTTMQRATPPLRWRAGSSTRVRVRCVRLSVTQHPELPTSDALHSRKVRCCAHACLAVLALHADKRLTVVCTMPFDSPAAVKIRTEKDVAGIREACRLGRLVLDKAHAVIKPGVTTDEIDRIVSARSRAGLLYHGCAEGCWVMRLYAAASHVATRCLLGSLRAGHLLCLNARCSAPLPRCTNTPSSLAPTPPPTTTSTSPSRCAPPSTRSSATVSQTGGRSRRGTSSTWTCRCTTKGTTVRDTKVATAHL